MNHDDSPPGYRRVWTLAWPIILSNLSIPLVGAVDTGVMGHLPDPAYLGAVAIGASLFSVIYWGFGFLRMGTTGFVAQAHGAGDAAEVRATLQRALIVAGLLAAALWLLRQPVAWIAFLAVDGADTVEHLARTYFDVRIWSAPAVFANYALIGTLIGLQRTRAVLLHQVVLNGTNIGLDLLFVPMLGWGVEGVAAASVIAEFAAVGVGLVLVRRHLGRIAVTGHCRGLLDRERLGALLTVNGNILIRTLLLVGCFFHFAATGARIGEIALAANAVLLQLQFFLAYGLDGFAHAVEGLAGSAFGRRSRRHFHAAVRTTTVCALVVALGFSLAYTAFGPVFIGWMTNLPEVREAATAYLPWMLLAPIVSVWSFQLDGIFIGTTRTVEMRNAMILSAAGFVIATGLLVPVMGNHGLWLALMLFLLLRAVTLGLWMPRLYHLAGRSAGHA